MTHVSRKVQLPNSASNPALSRYLLHRFLILLGEPEVIFGTPLFPEVDETLTLKSFRQLKQQHLYPQGQPCEKHGHCFSTPEFAMTECGVVFVFPSSATSTLGILG